MIRDIFQDLADEMRRVAIVELLPRHGKLRADQVHQHSDGSLFTEADLAAERALTAAARALFPDALVTGEEEISEDPTAFLQQARTRDVIIFDPIDGTGAFKRGEETYGVMAALIRNGRTEAGIIYTPGHAVVQADGTTTPGKDIMIVARRGGGSTVNGDPVRLDGRPCRLSDHARVAFACRNQDKTFEKVLAANVPGYAPRNNSSYDYTRILTDEMDATFYSEGFMPETGLGKCPPWDHAAGVLAVREAGGHAALPYHRPDRKWSGVPYSPLVCHDRLLVAANRTLFEDILRHIRSQTPALATPRSHNMP